MFAYDVTRFASRDEDAKNSAFDTAAGVPFTSRAVDTLDFMDVEADGKNLSGRSKTFILHAEPAT